MFHTFLKPMNICEHQTNFLGSFNKNERLQGSYYFIGYFEMLKLCIGFSNMDKRHTLFSHIFGKGHSWKAYYGNATTLSGFNNVVTNCIWSIQVYCLW